MKDISKEASQHINNGKRANTTTNDAQSKAALQLMLVGSSVVRLCAARVLLFVCVCVCVCVCVRACVCVCVCVRVGSARVR